MHDMLKNLIILLTAASFALLPSCKYPDIPKTYEIAEKLKIEYPPYLKRTTDIHPRGAFQAQNKYRDVYYIIVPHPWREDSAYAQKLFDSLAGDLKTGVLEPLVYLDTTFVSEKGYAVQEMKMSGKLKDKSLMFTLQLIQKDTTLYQTAGWYFKSKENLWQKDIDGINSALTILE